MTPLKHTTIVRIVPLALSAAEQLESFAARHGDCPTHVHAIRPRALEPP